MPYVPVPLHAGHVFCPICASSQPSENRIEGENRALGQELREHSRRTTLRPLGSMLRAVRHQTPRREQRLHRLRDEFGVLGDSLMHVPAR